MAHESFFCTQTVRTRPQSVSWLRGRVFCCLRFPAILRAAGPRQRATRAARAVRAVRGRLSARNRFSGYLSGSSRRGKARCRTAPVSIACRVAVTRGRGRELFLHRGRETHPRAYESSHIDRRLFESSNAPGKTNAKMTGVAKTNQG